MGTMTLANEVVAFKIWPIQNLNKGLDIFNRKNIRTLNCIPR